MSPLFLGLIVALSLSLLFHITFLFGRRWRNFGIVDAVWSLSFAPVGLLVAGLSTGWAPRRLVLAALATAWSLRLGIHLARRIASHHPVEDTRYQALREKWRDGFDLKMALFFQGQAVSVWVLGLPYAFIAYHPTPAFSWVEGLGFGVWAFGWFFQALADAQLSAFQKDPALKKGVCDRGLWRYSRHPNYFGEWLGWVGLAIIASASAWGWIGWLSPAVMLHLLLNVTGVPLTEERSLAKRGDAYRRYQATTSAFFPWFRRTPAALPPSSS